MNDGWIVIPNWDKFQHYKNRKPSWIKLYVELRDKDEWEQLTLAQQGLLINVWILYCTSDGLLKASSVPSRIPQKVPRKSLERLSDAGFIEFSASKPLALRYQPASPEKEKETPKSSFRKTPNGARKTGWRIVRGSHGMTTIPDPNGTDPAPTIGRPL